MAAHMKLLKKLIVKSYELNSLTFVWYYTRVLAGVAENIFDGLFLRVIGVAKEGWVLRKTECIEPC